MVTAGGAGPTGTAGCASTWGNFDMVGNVWEWTADWVPAATECPGWGGFSDDWMCLSGASTTAAGPGVLLRGGYWNDGASAGVFAVLAYQPWDWASSGIRVGFRCAR